MKTARIHITTTPAAREVIKKQRKGNPKHVRILIAKIDLRTTAIEFVRAIPLPTRGLERGGAAPFVTDKDGKRVTDDRILRDVLGIRPVIDVIRDFELDTGKNVVAWTGAANVPVNDRCLVSQRGEVIYREQEIQNLECGLGYPSLIILPDNTARIQEVKFEHSSGKWEPPVNAKLTISGQLLVSHGVAMDSYNNPERRCAFCDKRHLIRFPYCKLTRDGTPALNDAGEPLRRDFGLDQMMVDEPLLNAAIEGRVVMLSLSVADVDGRQYDVQAADLISALHDKGYLGVDSIAALQDGKRGHYYVNQTGVHLVFETAPYPQHIVALRPGDPHLYEIVVGGWSNNAGVTILGLTADLVRNGFNHALLLDNGGDSVFVRGANDPNGPDAIVPSSLGRKQWAGILAYTNLGGDSCQIEYGSADHDGTADFLDVSIAKTLSNAK